MVEKRQRTSTVKTKAQGPSPRPGLSRTLPEARERFLSRNVSPSPPPAPLPPAEEWGSEAIQREPERLQVGTLHPAPGDGKWDLGHGLEGRDGRGQPGCWGREQPASWWAPSLGRWWTSLELGVWVIACSSLPTMRGFLGCGIFGVKPGKVGHLEPGSTCVFPSGISHPLEAVCWLKGRDQTTDGSSHLCGWPGCLGS